MCINTKRVLYMEQNTLSENQYTCTLPLHFLDYTPNPFPLSLDIYKSLFHCFGSWRRVQKAGNKDQ